MISFKNRSIAATAAIFATFVTVAAATPLRAETVREPVSYADLDIHSDAGRARLDARVRRAADRVCRVEDASSRLRATGCRSKAIGDATAQIERAVRRDTALAAR